MLGERSSEAARASLSSRARLSGSAFRSAGGTSGQRDAPAARLRRDTPRPFRRRQGAGRCDSAERSCRRSACRSTGSRLLLGDLAHGAAAGFARCVRFGESGLRLRRRRGAGRSPVRPSIKRVGAPGARLDLLDEIRLRQESQAVHGRAGLCASGPPSSRARPRGTPAALASASRPTLRQARARAPDPPSPRSWPCRLRRRGA